MGEQGREWQHRFKALLEMWCSPGVHVHQGTHAALRC